MISFLRTKFKETRLIDLSLAALEETKDVKERAKGLREFVESLKEDARYGQH